MAVTPNTPRLPERFVAERLVCVDNPQRNTNCRLPGLTRRTGRGESLAQPPIASNYMTPRPTSNSLVPEAPHNDGECHRSVTPPRRNSGRAALHARPGTSARSTAGTGGFAVPTDDPATPT